MPATRLIGLDCAVQVARTGLALGTFADGILTVHTAHVAEPRQPLVVQMLHWLMGAERVLIACDAPLGWPAPMGHYLPAHCAGEPILAQPNDFFRRTTDLFVKATVGQLPLDVGADRIARTAHAALATLDALRHHTGLPLPLAWSPDFAEAAAVIEVYPAATLRGRGWPHRGYKGPGGVAQRAVLLQHLATEAHLPHDTTACLQRDDALDAVLCLLAAADFLRGEAFPPLDLQLARKEGWIWVRGRRQGLEGKP